MKLLFADKFSEAGIGLLTDLGHECRVDPNLGPDNLPTAIGDAEVLIVRSTKVQADTLEAAPSLGMVIRAGAGTNTIDKRAAASRGIYVCNVPGTNSLAVAELTMGLILSIDRRIPDAVSDLRQETWNKSEYSKAAGLAGKRLGVVGLGAIGLAVARRATAFDIDVVAEDKPRPAIAKENAIAAGVTFVDSETMYATSDIISIHVPLSDETRGLVDAAMLAKCKDGAWIINTSRGEVVHEEALLAGFERAFDVGWP